ncbi:MAG TPA: Ltp family lipoprotein [Candidatus Dormibacteraeota bacterium]
MLKTAFRLLATAHRGFVIRVPLLIATALALAVLAACGAPSSGSTASDISTLPPDNSTLPPATSTAPPVTSAPTPVPTPTGPILTAQQQRAAQAAQQYLKLQGFSQQGLIDQLSSSYGDAYSVQDATVAVDSLNVDWNAEAVQAAKSYLALQPFSCNELIQQLDSSAGEKFTVAQATYGATQAGAC